MASLHQLKRTSKRAYRRLGRGQGSKRGKTSGRGGKGQTARSGHKIRPALRDIIKKLPKRRGWGKNRGRTVNPQRRRPSAVPLSRLERLFAAGSELTVATLKERGAIARDDAQAKIIGSSVAKAFYVKGIGASPAARVAIEKAGGSIA